ncbi:MULTISPECIES: hypothetical protein [unclassified Curtobacterium]|uniref:hypothetical protein n=1 Tax=unclassified Curtobacterium TaxID=257496 RepID=UPI0011B6DC81|nr:MULTISPECIES: hypothetical protein [unclassified Curtobacterium]WIB26136.1 hypothetical protein DEJ18_13960 [Curtobacterium sp. MCSS17_015]
MRARVLVSVAVAATIALGATGCEFLSPSRTQEIRQITDGVDVSTGTIDVRNALLITDTGEDARFVGTLVNTGNDDRTVTLELDGTDQTVEVPSNSTVVLADDEEHDTVDFDDVTAKPGSLVKMYFSYQGAEGASATVPVLTSAQEEYQTLAPTPTPTPTETSPSVSGTQPTGGADAPGTQEGSQTDSSEGDNGTE